MWEIETENVCLPEWSRNGVTMLILGKQKAAKSKTLVIIEGMKQTFSYVGCQRKDYSHTH